MIYRIGLIGLIGLMGINLTTPTFAIDRNAAVAGARSIINVNNTYNITTVMISAGSVTVGSTDYSLPAYQQIAQITAQIQQLKERMKYNPTK